MAILQLFCSAGPPRKRDSLHSWLVCACATITWAASLGLLNSFSVFLPVFMDYFKASRQTAAWVGSLAIALTFFTGHLSTAVIMWFGCRVTTLIGGAFCVVSLITSSFVENISVLFLTYSLLFGLGCSCTFSSGLVVISQFFKKRQSIATGVLGAGTGGGMLIMGPTLDALIRAYGWQTCLRIMAIVLFFSSSLAITFDPNVEAEKKKGAKEKEQKDETRVKKKGEIIVTKIKTVFDLSVWKESAFIAFLIGDFVIESGCFVPHIHLVRYCEELGISSERASQLLIYYGLCSMIGRLLAGILCSHPRVSALIVFQAAAFISGLNTIILTLARSYFTPLVISVIIFGLSAGFFYCTMSILILTVSPLKTAAVIGWKMMLVSIAQASGPPLVGLMADKLGSYVVPFRVAGGVTLTGALIPFLFLCCSRRNRTELMLEEEEGHSLLSHSSDA